MAYEDPTDVQYILLKVPHSLGPFTIMSRKSTKPTLEELQEIVGGLIQPAEISDAWKFHLENQVNTEVDIEGDRDGNYFEFQDFYANEEGLLLQMPFNGAASAMTDHFIVGDVAIVLKDDMW